MALTFVAHRVDAGGSATPAIDPESIPQETRDEVTEAIEFFKANPEGIALRVEFPTNEAKQQWVVKAQAYSLTQNWVMRVSPGRGQTSTGLLQFRMYPKDVYDKRKAETARITAARKAANGNGQAAEAPAAAETPAPTTTGRGRAQRDHA